VLPNLERIPSTGDARAQRLLGETPHVADSAYLNAVDAELALVLGQYGVRQATIALRHRSVDRLAQALVATALYAVVSPDDVHAT
jgi:hypothetical protein